MKQRTITAVLALLVFVPIIIMGGMPFTIFIYLLATIGLIELIRMRPPEKHFLPYVLSALLTWVVLLPDAVFTDITWFTKYELISILIFVLLAYTVLVQNAFTFDQVGFVILAAFYVGLGFFYLLETRDGDNALRNILFAFFIIWATDTGAYLFGRKLGKRKLLPAISPKKTVEGALGGIFVAVVVAVIFHLITPFEQSLLTVMMVTVIASCVGQIGDLVESAFKRIYNVKDSGKILPGHGGILDRFDSMLFVFPLLHFIHFF
ncbi:phosphatidate cytidylyltransferase [Oceanobacillus timonensis]|uniref:phosphatidate cytidylyltransferase n=1 Tax=Oceanobacillus timonensis TaxID=1926285 RepID=UPI0009BC1F50|nr:phosphatidate cytidylyltransferase [Oceanobacillus timonensis]